jgi:hypothetical protein
LSGKTRGVNVGLLNMQTERVGGTSANNFTVARVNRDLRNRSSLGAMFVNKASTGSLRNAERWNRTFGVDGKLGVGETMTFSAFAARTDTPGLDGREHAYSSAFDFRTRKYESNIGYVEVGEDFNPEVGFLERTDGYRQVTGSFRRHIRTEKLASMGLREWEPHASYESYWGFDGLQETATLHIDSRLDFENGYGVTSTALNVQWEGLRQPFEVYPGVVVPAGEYRSPYFLTNANTDRRKWLSGSISCNIGGFLSGSQVSCARRP